MGSLTCEQWSHLAQVTAGKGAFEEACRSLFERARGKIGDLVPEAIVTDIEGTTTSIPFVKEILFPYARRELGRHIRESWGSASTQGHIEGLKQLAKSRDYFSEERGDSAPYTEDSAGEGGEQGWAERFCLYLMDIDAKATPLKALQGEIWKGGYAKGELKGEVFPDVPPALARWQEAGIKLYVYSSGSIGAQKLLFGHSTAGDLLPRFSGHFDTTTGGKREAESYRKIASALGTAPEKILFLTDLVEEAVAARDAGIPSVLSMRARNHPLDAEQLEQAMGFPIVTSFDQIAFPSDSDDASPPAKRQKVAE